MCVRAGVPPARSPPPLDRENEQRAASRFIWGQKKCYLGLRGTMGFTFHCYDRRFLVKSLFSILKKKKVSISSKHECATSTPLSRRAVSVSAFSPPRPPPLTYKCHPRKATLPVTMAARSQTACDMKQILLLPRDQLHSDLALARKAAPVRDRQGRTPSRRRHLPDASLPLPRRERTPTRDGCARGIGRSARPPAPHAAHSGPRASRRVDPAGARGTAAPRVACAVPAPAPQESGGGGLARGGRRLLSLHISPRFDPDTCSSAA